MCLLDLLEITTKFPLSCFFYHLKEKVDALDNVVRVHYTYKNF